MLTVRGRFVDGRVILLEEVPLEGERDVLVTFLDSAELVSVPRSTYDEAARAVSLQASTLSPREIEVLRLLQLGLTNREIAARLEISSGTVRNHTSSIYEKLDVRNRTEAVARASALGLLAVGDLSNAD
jgi:DNA-binding NarL/FixJ family response regulator